jgi:hypothetical protein
VAEREHYEIVAGLGVPDGLARDAQRRDRIAERGEPELPRPTRLEKKRMDASAPAR